MNEPWIYEPCSPEDKIDPQTRSPYEHAVRGARPTANPKQPAIVSGFGHTPPAAQSDAERAARVYDAEETLRKDRPAITLPPSTVSVSYDGYSFKVTT